MVPAKACLYLKLRATCSTHICLFGICLEPSEKVKSPLEANEKNDPLCCALCSKGSTLTSIHSDHPPAMFLPTEQGAHVTKDTSTPNHAPSTCRSSAGIWNLSFMSKGSYAAFRAITGPSSPFFQKWVRSPPGHIPGPEGGQGVAICGFVDRD